jgi:hypothetical protein
MPLKAFSFYVTPWPVQGSKVRCGLPCPSKVNDCWVARWVSWEFPCFVQIPTPDETEYYLISYSNGDSKEYLPDPWDNISVVRYCTAAELEDYPFRIKYEKGFPYYEMKMTYKNEPQSYEDTQMKVRGLSEADWKDLQQRADADFIMNPRKY